ncbi:MAG: hydantoinase/oxoprolinase family protein [Leucobacter sp.]
MGYIIGVDVGGTFTDGVLADGEGKIYGAKAPSTPPNYTGGFFEVLEELAEQAGLTLREMLENTHHISHGTTSSLNALVMGTVPDIGFITTRGHRDSIYIMNVEGRYLGSSPEQLQSVITQSKSHALIPRNLAYEVTERVDRDGNVLVQLDEEEVRQAARELVEAGVPAIAVSLLWSFRNDAHEKRVREIIAEVAPDMFVAISSEVSPRIREFSRSATTIMSAQIAPGLRAYLGDLEARLRENGLVDGQLLIMQSNGGAIVAEDAPSHAISTVGSVLTGGVVGAVALGGQLDHRNIIATDVGGTTFLTGMVVDGEPVRSTTTVMNHHPINVPRVEVDAIGSGGGAIAWLDQGGNLLVGPKSAQAVPGPACYDQGGTEPTNTDANLVLGILPERGLLGGRKALDREKSREAIRTRIAEPLGLSIEDAAAAIYAVQINQTADLLRKTVVEAGHDPREFVLYAFGGAGPANCAGYAAELGVEKVVVPLGPLASAFSAYGLATSDVVLTGEYSDPTQLPTDPKTVEGNFMRLETEMLEALEAQGMEFASVELVRELDMRYAMQLAELPTEVGRPVTEGELQAAMDRFEQQYAELFGEGSGFSAAGIQGITYRVRAVGKLDTDLEVPAPTPAESHDASAAVVGTRPVRLDEHGYRPTTIYDYTKLKPGHELLGPAVIEVPTTTVVLPSGMTGVIDRLGNLEINTQKGAH